MILVYAITLSMALHFALLYIPFLRGLFGIVPLGVNEWKAVLWISAPIIGIDEVLKWMERTWYVQQMPVIEGKRRLSIGSNGAVSNGHLKHE
jgi:Ca2+ transporting ATPase